MDNLCHTLVGAACGEAGLKRRTALGSATLMVAANLPDLDALVFVTDTPSVAFRRGWTHGVLAQALLPVALAVLVATFGRRRGARFGPVLLLSYVGVLSHVALDLLNNYGVRVLMPFSGRWFYGDSVFIIDPWLWIMFGLGVWGGWNKSERAARAAVVAATIYIVAMVASAVVARSIVIDDWRATHGDVPRALMVGPMAMTPFHRVVIVDAGDHYRTGTFTWFPRRVTFDPTRVPKRDDDPAVLRAKATSSRMQAVLIWARFPYYLVEPAQDGTIVILRDLRFGDRVGGVAAKVTKTE